MALPEIPVRDPLIGADGRITRAWYEWLKELKRVIDELVP